MISDGTAERLYPLLKPYVKTIQSCLLPGEQIKFDYPNITITVRAKGSRTRTKTIIKKNENNN